MQDLEELALETGTSIQYPDGRKFNTSGAQAKLKQRPPAPPAPEVPEPPEAPEPPNPEVMALLRQLVNIVARPVEVQMPHIPAPQVTVQAPPAPKPTPPREWTFTFERNSDGTIKRINAKAKE